jgi:hypothetical protein
MKLHCSLVAVLVISLTACNVNRTYMNREEDKNEAQKVTDAFYTMVRDSNYNGTLKLYSDTFFTVSPKEKLFQVYLMSEKKLGRLQRAQLTKAESKVVEGSNPVALYALQYTNRYDSAQALETFQLRKERDGKIRILAYNINSDAFFK